MRRKTNLRFLLLSIVLTTTVSSTISAQTSTTLKGTVSDEQQSKVPSAQVTLRSESGLQMVGVTNDSGAFVFRELKPGVYLLEVRANGFSTYSHEPIQLKRGEENSWTSHLNWLQSMKAL
jgi:hypothetical protein